MNYVTMKLYINEIDGDWHDINEEEYEKSTAQIHEFAKQHNSRLFFTVVSNDGLIGPGIDCDVFAQIEYTEELSEEEKNEYVAFLKEISKSAEVRGKYLTPYETLTMVSFRRVVSEVMILDKRR